MEKNYSKIQVYKNVLQIAWPAIAEQSLIMMVGVVSTIFVGRLGTADLAAVGLINLVIFFFQAVFAGLATGATVIIARVTGEGEMGQAKLALMQSLFLGILAGFVITIPGYVFATPILKLFFIGADPQVLAIAHTYYKIILIGLPFLVVDMIVAGAVRGSGDTKTPMYVTLIVNIINVILSSLLIFGVNLGGRTLIPAYGIVGAGIAVMVSRICGGVLRVLFVFLVKGKLSLSLGDKYKMDFGMLTRIVRIGLPAFAEQAIMQGGFLMLQVMIISMGTLESASYQVGVNINSFAFMPIFGFAVAATTMVGQKLGSQDYEEAEIYAYESNKIAVAAITLISVLILVLSKPLTSLYSTDENVINLSIIILMIFLASDPFLGVVNVSAGVLRAAGDVMYVMVTALVGLWVFRVLGAYVLGKVLGFGIYGVMVGVFADFAVRAFMYGFRVKAGKWKTLKV